PLTAASPHRQPPCIAVQIASAIKLPDGTAVSALLVPQQDAGRLKNSPLPELARSDRRLTCWRSSIP
ncbi:MAG: hypothetical protein ACPGPS_16000, partial [Rubripirellula sp.]